MGAGFLDFYNKLKEFQKIKKSFPISMALYIAPSDFDGDFLKLFKLKKKKTKKPAPIQMAIILVKNKANYETSLK
jgi:hypothetical protein